MKKTTIEAKLYFISAIVAAALVIIASLTWYRSDFLANLYSEKEEVIQVDVQFFRLNKIHNDFVTHHHPQLLKKFEVESEALSELIEHISENPEEYGNTTEPLAALIYEVANYRSLFASLANLQQFIGQDETEGIRKKMQDAVSAAESILARITNINTRTALHRRLLMTQDREKDLILRGHVKYAAEFEAHYALLLADVEKLIADESLKRELVTAATGYRDNFRRFSHAATLVGLTYNDGLRGQLGETVQRAHEIVDDMRHRIEVIVVKKEKQLGDAILAVTAGFSLLILLLIHLVSRSISIPLKKMTAAMAALAKGEYAINIAGKNRKDEIGKMARALEVFRENAVERDRAKLDLQNAHDKLEERVAGRTKELLESEETLFDMIYESPVAIGITDESSRPVFWNNSFRKFGWRKEVEGGSNDFQLMFADPHLRRQLFDRLEQGEVVRDQEVEILTASEKSAWVEISIQKVSFEGQKSYLTWVYDITERKIRENVQAEARAAAEEANKAKSDFLATMSHEIRTPLNGIMTMAEMLDTTDLTSEQKGMAMIVKDSSATLVSIINDVLDFSKIESGKLDLDEISMSLVQVVEGVADLLGAQATEKGIHLLTYVAPEAHDYLEGDPVRLRQILTNLAGNAVKFTETGEVAIRVTAEGSPPDRVTVTFRVSDTGIGISQDVQAKLFEPFVQADTSTARRFGGTGLGLSISKALVEAMNGEMGVESEPGEGSTFWFRVQLKARQENRVTRKDQLSGSGALIVSENNAFSSIIEQYLEFVGLRVNTVAGYEEVMDVVRAKGEINDSIDMMFVDCGMPPNVIENLIEKVSASSDMAATRIVAMVYRARMLNERPDYIAKAFTELPMPVRRSQLWDVAAATVGLKSLDGELLYGNRGDDEKNPRYSPPEIEVAREAGVLILVAEDNPVNQQVIAMLLDRLGYAAEIVEDGVDALEAVRDKRYGLLLTDCHMPEMDGYVLTSHIRHDEERLGLEYLPIVALTADALIGTGEKCREVGMDAYLKKPLSKQELDTVILKFIPKAAGLRVHVTENSEVNQPVAVAETPVETTATDPGSSDGKPVFDVSYLDEITGGDEEMTKILIDTYIETTPELLNELVAAFDGQDETLVRESAHAIKGSSDMAGALRLGDICRKIQDSAAAGDLASVEKFKDTLHSEFESFLKAWEIHTNG